jgi:membrane protease YdiL (CAAX protease family)
VNSPRDNWFLKGCVIEAAFLVAAAVAAWATGRAPLANAHLSTRDALIGAAATLPPLAAFWWTLNSDDASSRQIRGFLDRAIRPVMQPWSLLQLAVISIIAGVGEEALFRGFLQGWLAKHVGVIAAVAIASVAFGLAHPISVAYAVVVAIIGIYLGLLWHFTGNLLAPIVTHALYDFVALTWFLRVRHKTET